MSTLPKSNRKKVETVRIPIAMIGRDGKALSFCCRVVDGKADVLVNGNAGHALRASRGKTIGCAISLMAYENKTLFPHEVLLVHVTASRLYIVDKVNAQNQPCHCVRYEHSYGHVTECNDAGTLKEMVKENPALMERSFTIRVPRVGKPRGPHSTKRAVTTNVGARRGGVTRGAMHRAMAAGFITLEAARQLRGSAKTVKTPPEAVSA